MKVLVIEIQKEIDSINFIKIINYILKILTIIKSLKNPLKYKIMWYKLLLSVITINFAYVYMSVIR